MEKSSLGSDRISTKRLPPQRGTNLYSVGYEKLIEGIKKHQLESVEGRGVIRFISGSWGAGKTHSSVYLRYYLCGQMSCIQCGAIR
jgi:pantothenate kinase-related protein Tda10